MTKTDEDIIREALIRSEKWHLYVYDNFEEVIRHDDFCSSQREAQDLLEDIKAKEGIDNLEWNITKEPDRNNRVLIEIVKEARLSTAKDIFEKWKCQHAGKFRGSETCEDQNNAWCVRCRTKKER